MKRSHPPLGLVMAASVGVILVVVPLAFVVVQACLARSVAVALLGRPIVAELLFNTTALIVVSTLIASVLGTAMAWIVERTDVPGRKMWGVLAAVPLAIPPFITSYAWVSLSHNLQDFIGAVVVVTSSYSPLVYLPVAAALRGMDPALEETGRALGLSPFACFRRIVLPQLRPALLGGMLLVALNVLVEFGAFALLRFRTFTTELYAQYRVGFNGPEASLLALVLMALCLLCLALEWRVRGTADYARLGRFVGRPQPVLPLGAGRWPMMIGLTGWNLAVLGVPLGMMIFWMTHHNSAAVSAADVSAALLFQTGYASVLLGMGGTALTMVLALPLGLLTARYRNGWVTVLENCAFLAQGVPGIVVALALVSITIHALHPLYQSTFLLLVAYAILALPLALIGTRAALEQAESRLEEAGRSLGLKAGMVLWRITLPLAAPGLGAAAAMVFVSIVTELTVTLLLAPIGTETLATQVWSDTTTLAFAAAAPYAMAMTCLSMLSSWVLARRFGRSACASVS